MTTKVNNETIDVPDAPSVEGLRFRRFRGECDYPTMLAAIAGSKEADGIERSDTLEDMVRNYRHLINCDPYQDVQLAEVDGKVVGYGRVFWVQEEQGPFRYSHFTFLLPAWRSTGIRRAMLRLNERRLRVIAGGHSASAERTFEAWASDTETDWESLLTGEGYQAVRYGFEMVRPDLDDIPDLPLPPGVEVRPVRQDHYRAIWQANNEAFRDHFGYVEPQEDWFDAWKDSKEFQPAIWQVAWDGDQVVGAVQNFLDGDGNREYGRLRGWTEGIFVRRPWRRQGVARALIARSFRMFREMGMTEAALGVDANNPNGALRLYRSMGFQVVKKHTTYRKPLD